MFKDLRKTSDLVATGDVVLTHAPAHWHMCAMRSLIKARSERNRVDLPLMSVARERGVFVRSSDDDNHNVIPDDLTNYKLARKGDLVINKMKAWQGSLGLAPEDGIVSPAYYVYDFAIENRYFGQALLRSKAYVAMLGAASDGIRIGQWDLSIPRFRELPVLIPPADEQVAIVKYLGHAHARIDRAIAAKRKLIALLEEQKQAIIHQAVTHGLDPSVQFKDSGMPWLGQIPAHWRTVPLKRVVSVSGGMTPSKENQAYWRGDVPWVSPKDMKVRHIFDSIDHVSNSAVEDTSLSMVAPGTVLMVVRGMILARKVPVAVNKVAVTINQDMKALRPRVALAPEFLLRTLEGMQSSLLTITSTSGHGTKRLDSESWERFQVSLPPMHEQVSICNEIDSKVAATESVANRAMSEIELLREFRTRLTSDVVTGQVDVREIAATLPELTGDALDTVNDVFDDDDALAELRLDSAGADE